MPITEPSQTAYALESVSKRFGGVQAVRDVSLRLRDGTVHGLVGENGAGKSTVGKLISGAEVPDSGIVRVDGVAVDLRSPRDALQHGITRISQEIAVVPGRSVLENVFVGMVPRTRWGTVDVRRMRRSFAELTERTGFHLPADARVGSLNLAEQQKVEILRAAARGARLIVMDEPTAALTGAETARLMRTIGALAEAGTTVLIVSHFLDDVLSVADEVTIMRDGGVVRSNPAQQETVSSLVEGMLGMPADVAFPARLPAMLEAPVALRVQHLERRGVLSDVSFEVRAGEILGVAGLVGSGRSELLRAVFGADRRTSGTIEVSGRRVASRTPADAIRAGIAMVPESRKLQGLHLEQALRANITLPSLADLSTFGVLNRRRERARSAEMVRRLGVHPAQDTLNASALSGGNQQRVLFAKWLATEPAVLLADEPTRGVDVGGKRAIYDLLVELAAHGMAVVVVSSELEEIVGLADRVLVMHQGRIAAQLRGDEITEERILHAAFGQGVTVAS